jgi:hypothetical protein
MIFLLSCLKLLLMQRQASKTRAQTLVRRRERSVAIHGFSSHGLLHCVRNDGFGAWPVAVFLFFLR